MDRNGIWTRLWVGLTASVLLAGLVVSAPPASAITKEALNRGMLSTVMVLTLNAQAKVAFGSVGTVIDPKGYILASWSAIGVPPGGEDASKQNLKPGDLYHPRSLVWIAPTKDVQKRRVATYRAQKVAGDADLRVAVLKIMGMTYELEPLPRDLGLVAVQAGDSASVRVGDPVHVAGTWGQGDIPIAPRSTTVVNFIDINNDRQADYLTTGLRSNEWEWGELLMDDAGRQVGFASAYADETGAAWFATLNTAQPLIAQARQGTGGAPAAAGTAFGQIAFGTDVTSDGRLVGQATQFASGTREVFGHFSFQGMRDGMRYGYMFFLNGKVDADERNSKTWKWGERGTSYQSVGDSEGLPDGAWELVLFIEGKEAQRGTFTVGGGASPVADSEGVVYRGKLVDADTKRPIANAVFGILTAGVTFDQWEAADFSADMVAAEALADQNGLFQTEPPIERGKTYSALALAKGYAPRLFENQLKPPADADPVLEFDDPIALKQEAG